MIVFHQMFWQLTTVFISGMEYRASVWVCFKQLMCDVTDEGNNNNDA